MLIMQQKKSQIYNPQVKRISKLENDKQSLLKFIEQIRLAVNKNTADIEVLKLFASQFDNVRYE